MNSPVLIFNPPQEYPALSAIAPLTRDELWALLDYIQDECLLTPAAERMIKQGKRARHDYRVAK